MKNAVMRFNGFVRDLLLGWILSLIYVAGLTLLFPFLYFLAIPGSTSPTLLAIAAALIVLSFFGFLWHEGNLGKALKSLSKITLIPGMIGIVFSLFGKEIITAYLQGTLTQAGVVASAPVMATALGALGQAVPKIQTLTALYVLLGIFLWFLGDKFEGKGVI